MRKMIDFELVMDPHERAILEQIDILYGLNILKYRKRKPDMKESLIREVLEACETDYQMTTVLHDIKVGNETIEQMLKRKGLL